MKRSISILEWCSRCRSRLRQKAGELRTRLLAKAATTIGFIALFLMTPYCHAHDLLVTGKTDGNRVKIEARFDDGTAARGAKVEVHDAKGNVVAKGKTDAHGIWHFEWTETDRCEIHVNAGGGHYKKIAFGANNPLPSRSPNAYAFPWAKVTIGIAAIGVMSLALLIAVRLKLSQAPNPATKPNER